MGMDIGQVKCGTVHSWTIQTGSGIIKPNEGASEDHPGGGDVHVSSGALTDGESLEVGSLVTFCLGWDDRNNRYCADMCVGASDGTMAGVCKNEIGHNEYRAERNMNEVSKADYSTGEWGRNGYNNGSQQGRSSCSGRGGWGNDSKSQNQQGRSGNSGAGKQNEPGQDWPGKQNEPEQRQSSSRAVEQNSGHGQSSSRASEQLAQQRAVDSRTVEQAGDNLFVAGLPLDLDEGQIKQIFDKYCRVTEIKVLPPSGKPDKAVLIRMENVKEAQWLVEHLNGNTVKTPAGFECVITVRYAQKGGKAASTADAPSPQGPAVKGCVKVWFSSRGMGFITPEGGGEDVFVHKSDLIDGDTLSQGSEVSYESLWDNRKQKPVAKRVIGAAQSLHQGQGAVPAEDGVVSKSGVIKVWFEDKGYGFITPTDRTNDAYVHKTACQDGEPLITGMAVTYEAQWDAARNRTIASKCWSINRSQSSSIADESKLTTGIVKAWFEDKGFGFITGSDGSGDLFCHKNQILDGTYLTPGAAVRYEAHRSSQKRKSTATKVLTGKQEAITVAGDHVHPSTMHLSDDSSQLQPVDPLTASDQILVGNIPSTSTEETMTNIFGAYGTVTECKQVMDTAAGKSFVLRMASLSQAAWLCQKLNGNMPVGLESPISVSFAPPAIQFGGSKASSSTDVSVVVAALEDKHRNHPEGTANSGARFNGYRSAPVHTADIRATPY